MPERLRSNSAKSALISGASIAGPTLAFWLDRYGFDVTVVERAPTIRTGGYPIDVRGPAVDVMNRMGLLPGLRAAHIHARDVTFVDANGRTIGHLPIYEAIGNDIARDIELPRGTLASLIFNATARTGIRYRFNDTIANLHDDGRGVDVRFANGDQIRYAVVIGADGVHSATRARAFGAADFFTHTLGLCFSLFTVPNEQGLSHGGIVHSVPGRTAALWAIKDNPVLYAFLAFTTDDAATRPQSREAHLGRTIAAFNAMGWEVPRLLNHLAQADDPYFDVACQIRMPAWARGRVGLVGDAAFAPSFRSGQGSSLALVGSYVLAGELATHDDPADAFAAYERRLRPFVEACQALATDRSGSFLIPRTEEDIAARDRMLAAMAEGTQATARPAEWRGIYTSLALPDYPAT